MGRLRASSGGSNATVIDMKQIIRLALDKGAASVVLIHNHPSGNPAPGPADIRETERIRNGLAAVGLSLLDHIVVADDSFFSFADDRTYRAGG